ncbi:amidoligase family protein [Marinobacterium litorale]|uniref:amidoligase family protein n=1 Tax=Marinobacterium litorale TaxID=404770 RepID=UPI0003F4EBB0|nr:amidoligase family protein [Marinobacterium litorale]
MTPGQEYRLPSRLEKQDGSVRRVGFELEFSGISLADTSAALCRSLNAEVRSRTEAEQVLEAPGLGKFNVELDWEFLKRKAAESGEAGENEEWLRRLSQAAGLLVPVEVVCPPVAMDRLSELDTLVEALRSAGAQGTEESLIAAYGVHINPEIPALEAGLLHDYLRAFVLLQWWLVEVHEVNAARRISPYIGLYPEAYVHRLLTVQNPDMATLIDDYLSHNPTRNRALDLLPLLAEVDEQRVRQVVEDPKIKSRPTFHYRLPNCQIERPGWSLAQSWNRWWVVEKLAERPDALKQLGDAFVAAEKPVLGVNRRGWVEHIDQWLKDQELA